MRKRFWILLSKVSWQRWMSLISWYYDKLIDITFFDVKPQFSSLKKQADFNSSTMKEIKPQFSNGKVKKSKINDLKELKIRSWSVYRPPSWLCYYGIMISVSILSSSSFWGAVCLRVENATYQRWDCSWWRLRYLGCSFKIIIG